MTVHAEGLTSGPIIIEPLTLEEAALAEAFKRALRRLENGKSARGLLGVFSAILSAVATIIMAEGSAFMPDVPEPRSVLIGMTSALGAAVVAGIIFATIFHLAYYRRRRNAICAYLTRHFTSNVGAALTAKLLKLRAVKKQALRYDRLLEAITQATASEMRRVGR